MALIERTCCEEPANMERGRAENGEASGSSLEEVVQ